eukprot:674902-Pyramimonas_sp.AAC.1
MGGSRGPDAEQVHQRRCPLLDVILRCASRGKGAPYLGSSGPSGPRESSTPGPHEARDPFGS